MPSSLVRARSLVIVCFLSAVAAAPLSAQAVLRGFLYNDGTGERITGTVMVIDPDTDAPIATATTDSLGQFAMQVQRGTFRLAAIHPGFRQILSAPMNFQNGERLTVRIPIAESGDPTHNIGVMEHVLPKAETRAVAVSSRLEAFERRRRVGIGRGYDHGQLVESGRRTLGEFLQWVPGLQVGNPASANSMAVTRAGASSAMAGVAGCHLAWFLDGHRMDRFGRQDPMTDGLGNLPIESVDAVEVFKGISELPPEMAEPDVRCGAVAIWSRL